ncbi:hypothetical protein EYF80_011596 [Liparis tanakae]|uniref:Uncharacterized protein n=1 Tax=Liparis tanakae TaxID=230148 RepID=A0A4Z2IK00_9TELE|nr:hypothetical protein EYF80_011596 [Liparis tanakae]
MDVEEIEAVDEKLQTRRRRFCGRGLEVLSGRLHPGISEGLRGRERRSAVGGRLHVRRSRSRGRTRLLVTREGLTADEQTLVNPRMMHKLHLMAASRKRFLGINLEKKHGDQVPDCTQRKPHATRMSDTALNSRCDIEPTKTFQKENEPAPKPSLSRGVVYKPAADASYSLCLQHRESPK